MWTVFVFALAILASVTPTPAHDAPHQPSNNGSPRSRPRQHSR
jgi:hypothetical protein